MKTFITVESKKEPPEFYGWYFCIMSEGGQRAFLHFHQGTFSEKVFGKAVYPKYWLKEIII